MEVRFSRKPLDVHAARSPVSAEVHRRIVQAIEHQIEIERGPKAAADWRDRFAWKEHPQLKGEVIELLLDLPEWRKGSPEQRRTVATRTCCPFVLSDEELEDLIESAEEQAP